ncbi:MAG: cysteine--tRNA ligase [Candidatus Buchananbacteria bacterium]
MLKIYNTLSRKKEEFKPLKDKQVSFYQCGPTVYWTQHIGNLRAMVLADLIKRSQEYLGYDVKFARNYTDVGHMTSDDDEGEDKMEVASKREKLDPKEIADKYIKTFEDDIKELNCEDPNFKPRATEYISQMIEMVQELLKKGFAYTADLAIYFDISKFENYTKLSKQDLSKNISDAGRGEVSDSNKKNSADFAVWYFKAGAHENALQTWPSPFVSPLVENGEGFPGWHLECSAMNKAIFGPTIDMHMGGIEHIPVHHTNEIAQSEAANGKEFVRYWMHNEHLTVDGGKMSKSQGTAYSLAEIKAKGFNPMVLRYFFMQAHYRSKQNFTLEALESAQTALNNLKEKILEFKADGYGKIIESSKKNFTEAIEDDFNIPQVLAIVWDLVKSKESGKDIYATLMEFDKVLGLSLDQIREEKIPQEVVDLAKERLAARSEKNWAESDRLRNEIGKLGYEIEDLKEGYKLKRK